MTDTIIQRKFCIHCQNSFDITQGDMEFYNKISPTFAGQKFQIPTPTLCPDCRQRRRLSFRNERNLYKRKCDASGKDIISIYKPSQANPSALSGTSLLQGRTNAEQQGFKVYDQKIRRSDARDPMEYGRDFDFSKTFTEQFGELMREVPIYSIVNQSSENCDYCAGVLNSKNCYLAARTSESEGIFYGYRVYKSSNCIDCSQVENSQECYTSICIENCYGCKYAQYSRDCKNSSYILNCSNCEYCFGCCDLSNKKYYIYNKEYTKEGYAEFFSKLVEFDFSFFSRSDFQFQNFGCENTVGKLNKGCVNCFGNGLKNCRDVKFCLETSGYEDSFDCYSGGNATLSYEMTGSIKIDSTIVGVMIRDSQSVYYSMFCFQNSHHLFGCIGLRNKSYCIFNKQYTKEEYEKTVANIITHMIETGERGEFFHPSLSPFGYNETVAQEYYPLENKGEVGEVGKLGHNSLNTPNFLTFSEYGYHRSYYQAPSPVADKVIDGKDLPDTIDEVSDDILKSAIKCEVTGKLFRIIPQELAFYRKHHIPLPRKHPDQRHKERMELRK